jgi:hypothetical protein
MEHEDNPPGYVEFVEATEVAPTFNDSRVASSSSDTQGVPAPPDISHDEELPGYQPPNVPIYEEPVIETPIASFILSQGTKKQLLNVRPDELSRNFPAYAIEVKAKGSIFSRKADFTLIKLIADLRGSATPDQSIQAPSEPDSVRNGAVIAHLRFLNHTNIPWMPRSSVTYVRNPLNPATYELSAPNFSDFRFNIGQRRFMWKLTDHPSTSLILLEHTSDPPNRIMSRFSYSEHGTDASRDQEVGRLDIYDVEDGEGENDLRGGLGTGETVELVIGTAQLVIGYWKNMGKHFRNNVMPSRCSIITLGGGSLRLGGFGSYAFA